LKASYLGLFLLCAIPDKASADPLTEVLQSALCVSGASEELSSQFALDKQVCYINWPTSSGWDDSFSFIETAKASIVFDSSSRHIGPDLLLAYYQLLLGSGIEVWAKQEDEWRRLRSIGDREQLPIEYSLALEERIAHLVEVGSIPANAIHSLFRCRAQLGECFFDADFQEYVLLKEGFAPIVETWADIERLIYYSGWAPLSGGLEPNDTAQIEIIPDVGLNLVTPEGVCVYRVERPWLDIRLFERLVDNLRVNRTVFDESRSMFRTLGNSILPQVASNTFKDYKVGIPILFVVSSDLSCSSAIDDHNIDQVQVIYRVI